MHETSDDLQTPFPVVAQYVVTFLKPEMLHVYRQITSLRAFKAIVVCQKREEEQAFPFPNIVIQPKPLTHPLRRIWQKQILRRPITIYRSEARQLLKTLHGIEAKLIHIYFGHIGVHLLPLIERSDLPVIVSFHGADAQVDLEKKVHRKLTQRVLEKATLILPRSESIANRLIAIGGDRSKIRVHRTGLPLADIPFHQKTVPTGGGWRCVQACRLIPKKGLNTSIRAFAAFAKKYPHATFTVAGEGPQLDALRSLARNLGVGPQVFFTGFLSQDQLRALYAESHLFLHPSEIGEDGNQEGIPNAMLEAMASGMPVVATTHGGIPEAVEHGVSGLLVGEHDAPALAEAMQAIADDSARYPLMSLAAANRVKSQFDLTQQNQFLEELYREAIQRFSTERESN